MKISRQEAQSGPVRWLLRISGWFILVIGIFTLIITVIIPENSLFPFYYFDPSPLIIGAFLVILDLLLPDPVREARRMKKKLKKLYRAVYNALPSNASVFELAKKTSGFSNSGFSNLEMQIRLYPHIAKALFQRAATKETLSYIHKLNPQASYEICVDILNTVKNQTSNNQPNHN